MARREGDGLPNYISRLQRVIGIVRSEQLEAVGHLSVYSELAVPLSKAGHPYWSTCGPRSIQHHTPLVHPRMIF